MGDPNYRWMLFVDGENFTIRGQKVARARGITMLQGAYYLPDTFLWPPFPANQFIWTPQLTPSGGYLPNNQRPSASRCYYYTGVKGDDEKLLSVRNSLRNLGFDPQVFKKDRQDQTTKAVDISLATEILGLAYKNSFDVVCLIAGDRDYVPLVHEIKRSGKQVYVSFFQNLPDAGLSDELRLEADLFLDLTAAFCERMQMLK
jgi:hypothetical protein